MFFSTVYDASMNLAEESERRCRQPVGRPGFWTQLTEVSSPLRVDDIFVFALVLVFGSLKFVQKRAGDFCYDDVFFADAGRSLD
jgi:hypothetical protein